MKRKYFLLMTGTFFIASTMLLTSAKNNNETITKSGNTTIINTTEIGKDIRGFKGSTPVKIYIQKNKVVNIEALPNHETPKYLKMAKTVLTKWNGKTVSKASKMKVDGVTGATFTSKSFIKNVEVGLEYYNKNR